ncbi:ribosome maturation factor RimM [Thermophagus xiamenensis]|uniref:Ribosome maturation factor RimM n=1 Tax=Thermophagus xiamenensis TaxID=385682 RepID=A0A1I1UT95_9BACT|nr:16S rRNA processing protein RimM [Thermophagus xiamenensis]SFD73997.1 16S rRNA processing protein RimM [Thermophagus xiamenensis]
MLDKSKFIFIGVVAKPHGIAGEVAIRLSPEVVNYTFNPSFIFIEIDGGLVPFRVDSFRYKNEGVILIKSPFLKTEGQIRSLMGFGIFLSPHEVILEPASLDNLNAFKGFKVIDSRDGEIGEISGIQDIAGNPLFRVIQDSGEILIPVAEEFIAEINDKEKIIKVELPDGLLDLYR